ncbi:nucleotidyltransferase family protein [Acuticoccus sediminis]|nr:nucleotidyltransferase family protein [Acuticoccus sediminis]
MSSVLTVPIDRDARHRDSVTASGLMQFEPAERFVLHCLAGDAGAAGSVLAGGVDLEAMARFALHHEVVGEVAARCLRDGLDLPEDLAAAMQHFVGRIVEQRDRVRRETVRLAAAFAAAGIDAAFAKGAVSDALYRSPGAPRTVKDLDVYIRAADFSAAIAALPADYEVPESATREPWQTLARLHHFTVWAGGEGLAVEIHWDIAAPWHGITFDLEAAREHAVPVALDGGTVRVFSPPHAIVFWAAELSKDSWVSLKKILDFSVAVRTAGDEALREAFVLSRARGTERTLRIGLLVAEELSLLPRCAAATVLAEGDATATRIARVAVGRLARQGRRLRFPARAAEGLLLARKHDSLSAQLRHVWNIIVLYRLRGWFGWRPGRARSAPDR